VNAADRVLLGRLLSWMAPFAVVGGVVAALAYPDRPFQMPGDPVVPSPAATSAPVATSVPVPTPEPQVVIARPSSP